jgi:hypothetical protein
MDAVEDGISTVGLRCSGFAAAHETEATEDNPKHTSDDEPETFVGGCSGDAFLDAGRDRIAGAEAEDQQDDADDENGDGERLVHDDLVLIMVC